MGWTLIKDEPLIYRTDEGEELVAKQMKCWKHGNIIWYIELPNGKKYPVRVPKEEDGCVEWIHCLNPTMFKE
jgi:hypothetical protein